MAVDQSEAMDSVLDIILNDEHSPVYRLINGATPQNDFEYLTLWLDSMHFLYLDEADDLVHELLRGRPHLKDAFPFLFGITKEVKSRITETLNEKMQRLDFLPRLERYLQEFPEEEREDVRKIILGSMLACRKGSTSDDLSDIAKPLEISSKFHFSLREDHPLFADKVIELESTRSAINEQLLQRDLVPNPVVFKIFAGLDVSEQDLLPYKDSRLLEMFGIAADFDLDEIEEQDQQVSDQDHAEEEEPEIESIEDLLRDEDEDTEDSTEGAPAEEEDIEPDESELQPYRDNLEYLYNEFLWIGKRAEIVESKNDFTFLDSDDQKKLFRVQQQRQKQVSVCAARLKKSKAAGFVPRLEQVAAKLKLNEFETNLLKILTANKIFLNTEHSQGDLNGDSPEVGELIAILVDDPMEQVKAKKNFFKNAKLVRSNLIQVDTEGLSRNFYECDVYIDDRLVEYFVGQDYDISNFVGGSMLYQSQISLDNVIIPQDKKDRMLTMVNHFPAFLEAKKHLDFSSVVEYGNSLVMLFVGPSGTGKTMLANALSCHLQQKILLFNLNNLAHISSATGGDSNVFSLLFREARMNNAILFFDESEAMLTERFNELLVEIEKHEGIVIFATNASFQIDEAMRRRINLILNFEEPGPALRKAIWEVHLPKEVGVADDVDLDKLAQRFEINGGLVKNAVFAALAKAVAESESERPCLTMDQLCDGAREQLRNKLFMSKMEEHRIPEKGFESVVLPAETRQSVEEIANFDKAKKVLDGEWGFNEVFSGNNGVAVLFYGPPGTGKTHTAEALAFETGKTLKVVNYAQVTSMWVGQTEKALEAMFKEIADTDSILLFDEADALFTSRTGVSSANDRFANVETDVLLSLIERHNTFAILTTNNLDNVDNAFFRRMQYIVQFEVPGKDLRVQLWHTLTPPKLPLADQVDFQRLAADFEFTGGDIKNAIFRAATRRAVQIEERREVSQDDLVAACRDIEKDKQNGKGKIGFGKTA